MNQLLHALDDLAGSMPDDPQRLTSVRARARALRRRRMAGRGAAASGAMAVALTGVAVTRGSDPTGGEVPVTTSSAPAVAECPAPGVSGSLHDLPDGARYQIVTRVDARILAVTGATVTVEPLEAHDLFQGPIDLTVPLDVELYDGEVRTTHADLAPGQVVRVILLQPEGTSGWVLAALTTNPLPDSGELPPDAIVRGNTVTLPSDC